MDGLNEPDVAPEAMEINVPSLIDWELTKELTSFKITQAAAGHCNATLALHVQRRYMYYMQKVIAVNYGAMMFSWASFLLPPGLLEERLNLAVTLL